MSPSELQIWMRTLETINTIEMGRERPIHTTEKQQTWLPRPLIVKVKFLEIGESIKNKKTLLHVSFHGQPNMSKYVETLLNGEIRKKTSFYHHFHMKLHSFKFLVFQNKIL